MLRPDAVTIDPQVQRTFDPAHAARIAKAYDPARFGLGHVSLREDGRYIVIDSQHRCHAAKSAGQGDVPVLFEVHTGLSIPQEAALFERLNETRKVVSAVDSFRLRALAGDPIATGITQVLQAHGLVVASNRARGTIFAAAALERVYAGTPNRYTLRGQATTPRPDLLSATLGILKAAWGDDGAAFDAVLLKGVAGLLLRHGDAVDRPTLSRLLTKEGTPRQFVGQINGYRQVSRGDSMAAAIVLLENIYNARRSEANRLPSSRGSILP